MNRNAIYDAWRGLSGASRAAIVLGVAALIVIVWVSPMVFSALFAGSLQSVAEADPADEGRAIAYEESVKANVDFISQRSPFFAPVGPKAEPPPRALSEGPKVTPLPRSYGGPKLVGLVGHEGAVFESNVLKQSPFLRVGETGGMVELVSIEQPWKARVRWNGAEFDINLFDRLEALPVVNYGGGAPGVQPTANIFGGPPATTAGGLDFSESVGDEDSAENN